MCETVIRKGNHISVDHFLKVSTDYRVLIKEARIRYGQDFMWERKADDVFFSQINEDVTVSIISMSLNE